MNLSETARLLGAIAAFDRRTVGDSDVIAWQSVLPDVPFDDALAAVRGWYGVNTDWMMPAHVRRMAEEIELKRRRAEAKWAPGQFGVPKDQAMPEISGPIIEDELPPAVSSLVAKAHIRAILPEGSREALMPRTVAWEREHKAYLRTRDAEPNPLYRPGGGRGYAADGVWVDEIAEG